MLIVAFIAEFVLAPLPSQEQNMEFQHNLLVQNQVGQLQAAIARLASATPAHLPYSVVEPVALGSVPVPPFGQAASGQIWMQPTGPRVTVTLPTSAAPPAWGTGSLCTTLGSLSTSKGVTTCTFTTNGCPGPETWNASLTSQVYAFSLKGNSGSCQTINVTGDHNTIYINQTANNMGSFNFTLFGSNNTVIVNWQGKTSSPMQFNLFGSNNTYQYGSSFNGNSVGIVTSFIGEKEPPGTTGCPYNNLASYDKVASLHTTGTSDTQALYFYNSIGTNNGPHVTAKTNEPTVTWENFSQSASAGRCAFMSGGGGGVVFPLIGAGILVVSLQNNYLAPQTVALEGGAVVLGVSQTPAVLVDPPLFKFSSTPSGASGSLTLVNLVGSPPTEEGDSAAGVGAQILSSVTTSLSVGAQIGKVVIGPPQLIVNTSYPMAWSNYFQSIAGYVSGAVTCSAPGTLSAPYTCLDPPSGTLVTLSVNLNVVAFSVTTLIVQISFY